MRIRAFIVAVAIAALLFAHGSAWAADAPAVDLKITSKVDKLVINEKGERSVVAVDTKDANVIPGDVVTFTVTYRNIGKADVSDIVIQNPIPKEMMYRHASATGEASEATFSVDGGKSFDLPERLFIKDAQGNTKQANVEDYTNVRWIVKKTLKPGADGTVSYKALLK